MLVCIVDPSQAERVLEAVYPFVQTRKAILTISDVQVVRGERF
jgi:dipeptidase